MKKSIAVKPMLPEDDFLMLRDYLTRNKLEIDLGAYETLSEKLRTAEPVPADLFPADGIRIGSHVTIADSLSNRRFQFVLVKPSSAKLKQGHIPFTAPLAAALIGCRAGQRVTITLPGGEKAFYIEAVKNKVAVNV